eukprot:scaffold178440_cov22-Tisochrysis_lutea.AAC.1
MERAGATLLSAGLPAEGGPPAPLDQSVAKRPRPPSEAKCKCVRLRSRQHCPWPRPHITHSSNPN